MRFIMSHYLNDSESFLFIQPPPKCLECIDVWGHKSQTYSLYTETVRAQTALMTGVFIHILIKHVVSVSDLASFFFFFPSFCRTV